MAAPAAPPRGGNALTRKLGPLPVWAWTAIGLAVGYVVYKHFTGQSGSGGQAQETQTVAAASPASSLGAAPSAGTSTDTATGASSSTDFSDIVDALGGQQAALFGAIEQSNQDVISLAAQQISYAQANTNMGSFQTQTQPAAATQPGGSNAPIMAYVAPSVATSTAPPAATVKVATKAPAPTRFYTYKRDVPLGPNQTVHFTTGRGYYAA